MISRVVETLNLIDNKKRRDNAVGTVVDITFYNGKEFVGIDLETAKKELEKEENYYPSDVVAELKNKLEVLRGEIWQLNDNTDCQDEYDNSIDEIVKLLEVL